MKSIVLFIFSLGIILVGLSLLKQGLIQYTKLNLGKILGNFTRTPLLGCITGLFITALVQSSSVVTLISMGLVDTGIITFTQALGILLGANIGTTFTGQIMAFNLETLAIVLFIIGLITFKIKNLRFILFGIGFIFLGMDFLSKVFVLTQEDSFFYTMLNIAHQSTPKALIIGIFITAIIQSSSAITGIIIVLAKIGQIDLITAIAIILGSNIGTCSTALIASLTSSKTGRRVAWAHILINIIGVIIIFPFIRQYANFIELTSSSFPRQIAHAQTIFNIISSLIILPFTHSLAKLIYRLFP